MADTDLSTEQWAAIPFAPGYLVSTEGRIQNSRGWILRPFMGRGYLVQTFSIGGVNIKKSVHTIVCAVFNGPQPEGKPHCAHGDGDRMNNRPENLRWATAQENAADGLRLGKYKYGGDHWTHKAPEKIRRGDAHHARKNPDKVKRGGTHYSAQLSDGQVRQIRNAVSEGVTSKAIAQEIGVALHVVADVRRRRTYAHVI